MQHDLQYWHRTLTRINMTDPDLYKSLPKLLLICGTGGSYATTYLRSPQRLKSELGHPALSFEASILSVRVPRNHTHCNAECIVAPADWIVETQEVNAGKAYLHMASHAPQTNFRVAGHAAQTSFHVAGPAG